MVRLVRKGLILPLKVMAYLGLAILLYMNFLGPDEVAELLKVKPSKEGSEIFALIIPEKVIVWTLATVILEIIDNLLSVFEPLRG